MAHKWFVGDAGGAVIWVTVSLVKRPLYLFARDNTIIHTWLVNDLLVMQVMLRHSMLTMDLLGLSDWLPSTSALNLVWVCCFAIVATRPWSHHISWLQSFMGYCTDGPCSAAQYRYLGGWVSGYLRISYSSCPTVVPCNYKTLPCGVLSLYCPCVNTVKSNTVILWYWCNTVMLNASVLGAAVLPRIAGHDCRILCMDIILAPGYQP